MFHFKDSQDNNVYINRDLISLIQERDKGRGTYLKDAISMVFISIDSTSYRESTAGLVINNKIIYSIESAKTLHTRLRAYDNIQKGLI